MSTRVNDIAVIGLGVMGFNMARNFASRGLAVSGFDLDVERARARAAEHPEADLDVADSLEALVEGLERPRRILMLVPSGKPVDIVLGTLDPLLEADDIVIDGGNSNYEATERRQVLADSRPWRFVGMGVSGGAQGALAGPAMMPGGDHEAWLRLQPVLEAAAAVGPFGPCVAYCGKGSAGHFVKMVHNGIEYGDMQLIAETATLLRRGIGLSGDETAAAFAAMNEGELESFLIEITAKIFEVADPVTGSGLLVDQILDQAGQKGTGRWTVMAAIELGVAVPTIAAAVDARVLSAHKALRVTGEELLGRRSGDFVGIDTDSLARALWAAKVASYAQGMQLLEAASTARGYDSDLAQIPRIWTAGCIIRARFLAEIADAFAERRPELLAFDESFASTLGARRHDLAKTVAAAITAGLPVPGLSASLAWIDSLTTGLGSASVIQAQRDYFGSHTYRRLDDPDTPIHTDWP